MLGVVKLRGGLGIPIDGEWARRPHEPWVIGLHSGPVWLTAAIPGLRRESQNAPPSTPVLAGNDCLVILDEVHLSRPFAQTLREVRDTAAQSAGPLPQRFQVVQMSATPAEGDSHHFALSEVDLAGSEVLRRRVKAAKSAELRMVGSKPPYEAISAEVKKILNSGLDESVRSVGVIVNRVRTAREVHRALAEVGYDAHLITGRMRPLDRLRFLNAFVERVNPDRLLGGDELTVVVSTQAIEVGADFSFDALITEVAPIDSLRQRFGRLDRRGTLTERTRIPAQAWVIGVKSELNPKNPDPVYGDAARKTWEVLKQRSEGGQVDFTPWPRTEFPEGTSAPILTSSTLVVHVYECMGPDQPRARCTAGNRLVSARYRRGAGGRCDHRVAIRPNS